MRNLHEIEPEASEPLPAATTNQWYNAIFLSGNRIDMQVPRNSRDRAPFPG